MKITSLCCFVYNFKLIIFWLVDVGHDQTSDAGKDISKRLEEVQDDLNLLRHVLQPREVPGSRAERSLCIC